MSPWIPVTILMKNKFSKTQENYHLKNNLIPYFFNQNFVSSKIKIKKTRKNYLSAYTL
jgi:uncharacterized membrane protein